MFADRYEAGNMLALRLAIKKIQCDYVFAITRGGVVVGSAIAKVLEKPLFPLVVKKITTPDNPELAIGAVTYERVYVLEEDIIRRYKYKETTVKKLVDAKYNEVLILKKNLHVKRLPVVKNKSIIVVDDGVATGATVKAAAAFFRKKEVKYLLLAIPVIAKSTFTELTILYNKIVALKVPDTFFAVGEFYTSFPQVEEDEINKILYKSRN